MPVPTSSLYDLLISTQGTIRVYKHTQQSLLLTQPLTTGPVKDEGRLATGELEMEPGVPQPSQRHRLQGEPWLWAVPHLQQHFSLAASNSATPCPADPRNFPGSLVLSFQLFWSPEQLWFSANFAYTAVSKNSSSVFTHVSQWSLLTTIDNIIMF